MGKEKICGIYRIINTINSKQYVGKSINIFGRWEKHKSKLRLNSHNNKHLQNAWNKYSEENFIFEIVEICNSLDLDYREIHWINLYKSINREFGYNLKEGGDGGKLCEESRKKISVTLSGRVRTQSERENISKSKKGKFLSEETKEKLRVIAKNSYHLKDFNNKKDVYQYNLDGIFIKKWHSAVDASNSLGILASNINACARGTYNQSGGYIWSYVFHETLSPYKGKNFTNQKKIISVDSNNQITLYDSISQACKKGFSKSAIIKCCTNRQKLHKNKKWYYFEEGLFEALNLI